jgi:hypothetical protein
MIHWRAPSPRNRFILSTGADLQYIVFCLPCLMVVAVDYHLMNLPECVCPLELLIDSA